MKDWGGILKLHRREAGISQMELAEILEVSSQAVSYWETGRRRMHLDDAEKAFRVLGYELRLTDQTGRIYCSACEELRVKGE